MGSVTNKKHEPQRVVNDEAVAVAILGRIQMNPSQSTRY